MEFKVIQPSELRHKGRQNVVVLVADGWDDWFKYSTMYNVHYFNASGEHHRIGDVKIGEFNMEDDQRRANIPQEFEALGEEFFSVGQDDSYYEALNSLGDEFRNTFLVALRDVALDGELFERAAAENVTGVSLLRFVSDKSVTGQFRRMAQGGARLSSFSFSYTPPPWRKGSTPPTLEFDIEPESFPPTNVHVLIGRNGVGKTRTVNMMTNALVRAQEEGHGDFVWGEGVDSSDGGDTFPNIVSVTFSAFDPFEPLPTPENRLSSVRYQYIGLKHVTKDVDGNFKPPKSPDDLAADFGTSVQVILTQTAKRDRWKRALMLLESDRPFQKSRGLEAHRYTSNFARYVRATRRLAAA